MSVQDVLSSLVYKVAGPDLAISTRTSPKKEDFWLRKLVAQHQPWP